MKRIYLDYAAGTPVDPEVLRAMTPYFTERFGNPGSLHAFGQEAIAAVDRAREAIAASLGADFRQILFTSSATEANNLALRGAFAAARAWDEKARGAAPGADARAAAPRIVISAIEHESILETARDLAREGADVVIVPVDARGTVDEKKIKESLTPSTILVSVMFANNEIGTVEPIARIAAIIKEFRTGLVAGAAAARVAPARGYPLLHTDAVQALQFLDCRPAPLGADLMTFSSHKIYGPKGAGALYVRDQAFLAPIVTGGGQEFGLRSGTENVPAIVGFAEAVRIADAKREAERVRIGELRGRLWRGIKTACPEAEVNGAADEGALDAPPDTLPNILNIYFPGRSAETLLTKLDLAGVAASAGSACRARAATASYVIEALGCSKERARESIRFGLGRPTTGEEIEAAVGILRKALA